MGCRAEAPRLGPLKIWRLEIAKRDMSISVNVQFPLHLIIQFGQGGGKKRGWKNNCVRQ